MPVGLVWSLVQGLRQYLGKGLSWAEAQASVEQLCLPGSDPRTIVPGVFIRRETQALVGYDGLSRKSNWLQPYHPITQLLDAQDGSAATDSRRAAIVGPKGPLDGGFPPT